MTRALDGLVQAGGVTAFMIAGCTKGPGTAQGFPVPPVSFRARLCSLRRSRFCRRASASRLRRISLDRDCGAGLAGSPEGLCESADPCELPGLAPRRGGRWVNVGLHGQGSSIDTLAALRSSVNLLIFTG